MYLSLRFEGLLAKSSVLTNFPQLPDVVVYLFPEFVDGAHKKFSFALKLIVRFIRKNLTAGSNSFSHKKSSCMIAESNLFGNVVI